MLSRVLLVSDEKEFLLNQQVRQLFAVICNSTKVEEFKEYLICDETVYPDLKKEIEIFNPQVIVFLTKRAINFAVSVNTDYVDIKVVVFEWEPRRGDLVFLYGSWFPEFFKDSSNQKKIINAILQE